MSYRKYRNNGPKGMISKYHGICDRCKRQFLRGEKIIWWPLTKSKGHYACYEEDYKASMSAGFEEDKGMPFMD